MTEERRDKPYSKQWPKQIGIVVLPHFGVTIPVFSITHSTVKDGMCTLVVSHLNGTKTELGSTTIKVKYDHLRPVYKTKTMQCIEVEDLGSEFERNDIHGDKYAFVLNWDYVICDK